MMDHITTVPTNANDEQPGCFIAVEGIDGSGTTTVVDRLSGDPDVVTTTEPAEHHWTGKAARRAINDDETHPLTDLYFFLGDRAYHLKHTIEPALAEGKTVISDRYLLSTYAYQQENIREYIPRPKEYISESMRYWVRQPDLTILLDLPVEAAMERSAGGDKYEVSEFQQVVRHNYLAQAERDPSIVVVDAAQPIGTVMAVVKQRIRETVAEGI